ncbi:MAG: winged helix DNA-binding domain-containing protein [Kofleriaceae bacterium]
MVVTRRIAGHQIARPTFQAPSDLVAWLGAVQAQDYAAVKWAIALRLDDAKASDATIERAIDGGELIRMHAMRWTWQIMIPSDARWIIRLVGPRMISRAAGRNRQLGLDAATLVTCAKVICRALEGGNHLTRAELATALDRAKISPAGQRLAHILGHVELDGLICNGARRGRQPTYTLLDLRAPPLRGEPTRDELLAKLASRYFTSRGPATMRDFMWWSGATMAETRAALAAIEPALREEVIDGRSYWSTPAAARTRRSARSPSVVLLPAFDEYLVAYQDRRDVLETAFKPRLNHGGGLLVPCVIIDGLVAGTWKRTPGRKEVAIDISMFAQPSRSHRAVIEAAARRYASFLQLPARIAFVGGKPGAKRNQPAANAKPTTRSSSRIAL